MADGYEEDFHGWALAQADALRRRSLNEIDWDNVVEEIESLSRSEARELASRLKVLVQHLLKWGYQPEQRSKSWERTIRTQRTAIEDHLSENPSLRPTRQEKLDSVYRQARIEAAFDTGLLEVDLPIDSPFDVDDVLDPNFWPGPPKA